MLVGEDAHVPTVLGPALTPFTHHQHFQRIQGTCEKQGPCSHSGSIPTCNVKDNDSHSRVTDVAGNEAAEPLLAGCVPQLQPDLGNGKVQGKRERKEQENGKQNRNSSEMKRKRKKKTARQKQRNKRKVKTEQKREESHRNLQLRSRGQLSLTPQRTSPSTSPVITSRHEHILPLHQKPRIS